ncbi:MAG: hypothetical protein R2729_13190 [Bryobacteraceae bacterium]
MKKAWPALLAIFLAACSARTWKLEPAAQGDRLIAPGGSRDVLSARDHHFRLYGQYERDAELDLTSDMRIKVVAPITASGQPLRTEAAIPDRPGAIEARTNATGYETAYYRVRPIETCAQNGHVPGSDSRRSGLCAWRFESGTATIGGVASALAEPVASRIEIPDGRPHLRLLFQRRLWRNDRSIALLASAVPGRFDGATAVTVGPGVAISPEIAVNVNGVRTWVALGSRVSGVAARGAANIEVRRRHKGASRQVRYPAGSNVILGVPLEAGDEIRYSR